MQGGSFRILRIELWILGIRACLWWKHQKSGINVALVIKARHLGVLKIFDGIKVTLNTSDQGIYPLWVAVCIYKAFVYVSDTIINILDFST